jgi:hypothetical protein
MGLRDGRYGQRESRLAESGGPRRSRNTSNARRRASRLVRMVDPSAASASLSSQAEGQRQSRHLGGGRVRPTLGVIVTERPAHLHKVKDAETGLTLIRPTA